MIIYINRYMFHPIVFKKRDLQNETHLNRGGEISGRVEADIAANDS